MGSAGKSLYPPPRQKQKSYKAQNVTEDVFLPPQKKTFEKFHSLNASFSPAEETGFYVKNQTRAVRNSEKCSTPPESQSCVRFFV